MYYSSGNYEAFARPRKPDTANKKTAWFIGAAWRRLPERPSSFAMDIWPVSGSQFSNG